MTRTTPELASSPQTSAPHQRDYVWLPTYDLTCNRAPCTVDLQWNRVSSLEPLDNVAETLPLGHRGLPSWWCLNYWNIEK
ncbi:hypothetical protein AVEN_22073-1 [Araneus ventricosus]|uniref:Uncharacterized protein n=1 Tax=Araneus ventricosus TaxID=182803 RepID=A0A4Y2GVM1_ARAVE|nr:hypothetical protein AVEN_22073-1 [Araneus ventricosus]